MLFNRFKPSFVLRPKRRRQRAIRRLIEREVPTSRSCRSRRQSSHEAPSPGEAIQIMPRAVQRNLPRSQFECCPLGLDKHAGRRKTESTVPQRPTIPATAPKPKQNNRDTKILRKIRPSTTGPQTTPLRIACAATSPSAHPFVCAHSPEPAHSERPWTPSDRTSPPATPPSPRQPTASSPSGSPIQALTTVARSTATAPSRTIPIPIARRA